MSVYYNLDINRLLNHKQTDYPIEGEGPQKYRTAHDDEIFKVSYLPAFGSKYEYFGIPFIFPEITSKSYDNLCFEGQVLKIPERKYSKLHLIGYSESGDFAEKVCMIGKDGAYEEVGIFFYSSWKGIEHWEYERKSNICRDAFLVKSTTESPRGVYCCSASINNGMEINKIKLPINPNMHVFSITLEA